MVRELKIKEKKIIGTKLITDRFPLVVSTLKLLVWWVEKKTGIGRKSRMLYIVLIEY